MKAVERALIYLPPGAYTTATILGTLLGGVTVCTLLSVGWIFAVRHCF
jgi:hypothetical protein